MAFVLAWVALSVAVGIGATRRCNRSAVGWFLLAVVVSPVLAAAFLVALGPLEAPADRPRLRKVQFSEHMRHEGLAAPTSLVAWGVIGTTVGVFLAGLVATSWQDGPTVDAAVERNLAQSKVVTGTIARITSEAGNTSGELATSTRSRIQKETTQVLVAARDVRAGQVLGRADLRWQDWPRSALSAIHVSREGRPKALAELEGQIARAPLLPGEPITEAKLANPTK